MNGVYFFVTLVMDVYAHTLALFEFRVFHYVNSSLGMIPAIRQPCYTGRLSKGLV